MQPGDDPGYAERAAAGCAITAVLKFIKEIGVERRRPSWGCEREATTDYVASTYLFNRRGDRLGLQATKAELAAVMEIQRGVR